MKLGPIRFNVVAAFVALGVPFVQAALEWPTDSVVIEATSEDGQVKAVFPMHNAGTTEVGIKSLDTSCHCSSARAVPDRLAPGEEGAVEVVVDLAGMSGRLRRTIRVNTDDGAEPMLLGIELNVTPVIAISPKLVWWNVGEQPAERIVNVAVPFPEKTKVLAAHCDSATFSVELLPPTGDAKVRSLRITAKDTHAADQARVVIDFEYAGKRNKGYLLAAVK